MSNKISNTITNTISKTEERDWRKLDLQEVCDSPWAVMVERYFSEFMQFYFPEAHAQINWTQQYRFPDQQFHSFDQESPPSPHVIEKVAQVQLLTGEQQIIYLHIEEQSSPPAKWLDRMFIVHNRIYDHYHKSVASLALLAMDDSDGAEDGASYAALGSRIATRFPTVRLRDFFDREAQLHDDPSMFALVTLGYIGAMATANDMQSRYRRKWDLIQLLFSRGWIQQRILDVYLIMDWAMWLPPQLAHQLWCKIEALEEQQIMRYVSSVEQFIRERERQQGVQHGASLMLSRLLVLRFGELPLWAGLQLKAATPAQKEIWFDRALEAKSIDEVFQDKVQ